MESFVLMISHSLAFANHNPAVEFNLLISPFHSMEIDNCLERFKTDCQSDYFIADSMLSGVTFC